MTYTSQYPTQDGDHVKSTTYYSASYYPYFATDPTKSLTGGGDNNEWVSVSGTYTNQRFHIDLGSGKIIKRIYYENHHETGTDTNRGAKNFTFWGSNSATAFAELTYAIDTDWTQLTTDVSAFDQHVSADTTDPKYVVVTNTTSYQYYAIKIADNYSASGYLGLRRVELQTEDGGGGWANIAKVNGITSANISKICGISTANIAKVKGVAV